MPPCCVIPRPPCGSLPRRVNPNRPCGSAPKDACGSCRKQCAPGCTFPCSLPCMPSCPIRCMPSAPMCPPCSPTCSSCLPPCKPCPAYWTYCFNQFPLPLTGEQRPVRIMLSPLFWCDCRPPLDKRYCPQCRHRAKAIRENKIKPTPTFYVK